MTDTIDVAFLDSGTGGIPYMLDLKKKCPSLKTLYLGDTANFPYGEKSREEITACALDVVGKIIHRWNPKTIVIACNTISVTALEELRKTFSGTPFVGTVPAIRLACRITKNKKIGLLATNGTVNHPYTQKLMEDYASDCEVFCRGDPDLVAFIEHNYFKVNLDKRLVAVKPAVDYFASKGCDTIILGCTHFTHIAKEMSLAAGPNVNVIDSRDGVSNQTIRVEELASAAIEAAGQSMVQGNSLENVKDQSFYVTELRNPGDEDEYKILCQNYSIPWGGLF